MFGRPPDVAQIQQLLKNAFLTNETTELNNDGDKVKFLGRHIQRRGNGIFMCEETECFKRRRDRNHGILKCKEAAIHPPQQVVASRETAVASASTT